ncbi:MAG: serine/threonine-protein kinase [Myxococcota bacterium]
MLGRLAEGGMSQLELVVREDAVATDPVLYVVKRPLPELLRRPDFRAMFFEEARLLQLVRHPNVVRLIAAGEDPRGPYLVLDFVNGVSGFSLLKHSIKTGLMLPPSVALTVIAEAAKGLHAAHELRGPRGEQLGLVHRDVSPSNILLSFDGQVAVVDFGIAKAAGRSLESTAGFVLKGKMAYMAPEQLRFERLDRRADLYSLGVVLFELLAGKRLHPPRDNAESIAQRTLREPPPDIAELRPDVEPEIVELLFDLLAKDRSDRPESAAIVVQRIEEVVSRTDSAPPLADYMAQVFADLRATRAARLADSVATALKGPSGGSGEPLEGLVDLETATQVMAQRGSSSRPRRRWLAVAAVFATSATVGALIVTGSDNTPPPEPAVSGPGPSVADAAVWSDDAAGSPPNAPGATRADHSALQTSPEGSVIERSGEGSMSKRASMREPMRTRTKHPTTKRSRRGLRFATEYE